MLLAARVVLLLGFWFCYVESAVLGPKKLCRVSYVKRFKEPRKLNKVMFFDLDDTLYRRSTGVAEQMGRAMGKYICDNVLRSTDAAAAKKCADEYYKKYGLTIKGVLADKPDVDPVDYEKYVDSHLQLESVLEKNEEVLYMLGKMGKARKWILTNAGWVHAERTLKLLGLEDVFEGVVHCDYGEPNFPAKPDIRTYERAMQAVGPAKDGYYFADDNLKFVERARELGWRAIHIDEKILEDSQNAIKYIENLPSVFPELFDE